MAVKVIKNQVQRSFAIEDMKDNLEYVNIDRVKIWEGNVKKHTDSEIKRLAEGIEKYGQWRPAVVWKEDKQIRVGNGMYLAITKILKQDHIWVLWKDFFNKAEADLAGAFDNKSSEWSEFDNDALRGLFVRDDIIELTGHNKKRLEEFSGFSEEDLQKLFIEKDLKKINDENAQRTVHIECRKDEKESLVYVLSQWAKDSGFTDLIVH
jgi:hypothetical protein